jgi:hypothetical protein
MTRLSNFILYFILCFIMGLPQISFAAGPNILNETLFEVNQQIWTSYDLEQFVKAKNKTALNLLFFKQADDDYELFVATRLLFYQTVDSMDTADLVKFKLAGQLNLLDLSANHQFESELAKIKLLNEITDSKFKNPSTKEKYDVWISYMKKKYNFIFQK